MSSDNLACNTTGQIHGPAQYVAPLLPAIAAHAAEADRTRTLAPDLVAALKQNNIMRMPGSRELGGLEAPVVEIANELRAIAPLCGSTAWCLWNHLCVFYLYAAALGPHNADFLSGIIARREWVCFGAGASSQVSGLESDGKMLLSGAAAFASGCRYADWGGVAFAREGVKGGLFTVVDLRGPGVQIRSTWNGSALRASATDHIDYDRAAAPLQRIVRWPPKFRAILRAPDYPVINPRYREDWVALSVMWLGAMAAGLVQACLDELGQTLRERIAIFETRLLDKPTIHLNLGRAQALLSAATDTVYAAMAETDARIAAQVAPTEGDYFRQTAAGMQAVLLCDGALHLLMRVAGGNGLREGAAFERRYRDFQAMPLHINGHVDRISEQLGRIALGLESTNPF